MFGHRQRYPADPAPEVDREFLGERRIDALANQCDDMADLMPPSLKEQLDSFGRQVLAPEFSARQNRIVGIGLCPFAQSLICTTHNDINCVYCSCVRFFRLYSSELSIDANTAGMPARTPRSSMTEAYS